MGPIDLEKEHGSIVSPARSIVCRVTMEGAPFNHVFVGLDNKTIELVTKVIEDCSYKELKE